MSSQHVVLAGDFPFPHGTAASARFRNLAMGLADAGRTVSVFSLANDGDYTRQILLADKVGFSPSDLPTLAYRNRGIRAKLKWLSAIRRKSRLAARAFEAELARNRPELALIYGRSYLRLVPFIRAARRHGVPVILDCVEANTSFVGFGGKLSPVYWDWALGERRLPAMVDAMSLITTTLQRDAARRGARHTHLLPSAEDFSAPPPEHPVRSGPYRVAYMGAMLPRDNPAFLADLVDALAARGSAVRFDIAGRYESVREADPFVARLAAHVGSDRVRLHGKLGDAELADLLSAADALVLPRRDAPAEVAAFPTRLAECLRTARPVLACAVGDIPLHLRDGEDAVLLDPADAVGAAAKVEALAASPDRGRALGVRGYLRGRERFDRAVHARALLDLADRVRRP